jgi:hypothetical protein
MGAWVREAAGWVLLGVGLAAFAVCYFVFLLQRRVVEAMILAFVGFTVFRGGLHLLKVAVAARAAREAGRTVEPPKPPRSIKVPLGGPQNPGRVRAPVVPGPGDGRGNR